MTKAPLIDEWEQRREEIRFKTPPQNHHRLFHLLHPKQFDRTFLDQMCELTTDIRTLAKTPEGQSHLQKLLAHKRAMLYFTQPSTRTFLSFNNACHILGIRTSEIRDSSTSSEVKGESLEDSIRTFSSYVDVIIMRNLEKGLAERAATLMEAIPRPIPIINAGSGKDQHPTQALLDIYTLERSLSHRGGIDGKVIGMMGDLSRGRTARSLAYLMKNYRNVRIVFIAPMAFTMGRDILDHLEEHGIPYTATTDLTEVIADLDAIYVTRIQAEHDIAGESQKIDLSRFTISSKELGALKEDAVIMHPLPRGPELHPEVDIDPRAKYWRQERNGMWMRAALLTRIFNAEAELYALAR
ncbi:MAG TPA: aspartate carbamoyltransferase [Gammaproteobacteria bacterium]|nr:aspartate carbamoyltransferase [Gammaproteobacteria bacterium]HIL18231.1 aspartate carbamoyltransferase [Gammaproteobacteria bacterium]